MDLGNEFHNFGAEMEKERSYSEVRNTGIDRKPFLDCLGVRLRLVEIGFNKLLIYIYIYVRGMFEMNCLFLSGDFKFQVSSKVLISCPRSTPRG